MKNKVISTEYVEKNYISIKKLKKVLQIEEYENIDVLSHISTLMSEVDRLEDIEDRKVQIECQLIFDEGVKSVEDKIKEKLEEITKEYYKLFDKKMSLECMNINGHRYNAMKLVLEELLGE